MTREDPASQEEPSSKRYAGDVSQSFISKEKPSAWKHDGYQIKKMVCVTLASLAILLVVFSPVFVPCLYFYGSELPPSDSQAFVFFNPQPNDTWIFRVTQISGECSSVTRGFAEFHVGSQNLTDVTRPPVYKLGNLGDQVLVVDQTKWETARPDVKVSTRAVIVLSKDPHRPSSPLPGPDPETKVPIFRLRVEDAYLFTRIAEHQLLEFVKDSNVIKNPTVRTKNLVEINYSELPH